MLSGMPGADVTRNLFDCWERVWHGGEFDLIPSCVAPTYTRHDYLGDRTVTPGSYREELGKVRADPTGDSRCGL